MYIVQWSAGLHNEIFDRLFECQASANEYANMLISNELFSWRVSNIAIERF